MATIAQELQQETARAAEAFTTWRGLMETGTGEARTKAEEFRRRYATEIERGKADFYREESVRIDAEHAAEVERNVRSARILALKQEANHLDSLVSYGLEHGTYPSTFAPSPATPADLKAKVEKIRALVAEVNQLEAAHG